MQPIPRQFTYGMFFNKIRQRFQLCGIRPEPDGGEFLVMKCLGCGIELSYDWLLKRPDEEWFGDFSTRMKHNLLTNHAHKKCRKEALRKLAANIDVPSTDGVNLDDPLAEQVEATPNTDPTSDIVTVYALIFIPTGERVYTGRTKDTDRRLTQHAARNSKCRLVRNAFRKHGRKSFALEPILRCRVADGDANESFWIIQNRTLYPDGYNLRHGSAAGEDGGLDTALVPVSTGVIPFKDFADEAAACAEAWAAVAEMATDLEDVPNETDALCRDLLRQVHPDTHGADAPTYTADEVSAMLNAIRETVA